MNELPEDWEIVKLLDIANISAGGTPRRNIQEYWKNGDIPWLKISDLKETYIKKSKEYITQSGFDNSSTKLFPEGTIVYSIFATLGAVGILDIQATTNQAIAGIIPNNEIVDSKYLYYCLISEKNKICAKKSHATQDNINLTILRNHEIPLPPLPTQKKIVAILDKAEKLKGWRREADKLTDEFLKSTFLEMFGHPLSQKNNKEKLKNFIKIIVPTRDKPKSFTGTIPWITLPDLTDSIYIEGSKNKLSKEEAKPTKTRLFPKNTVILSCAGSLGKVAIANREIFTNQQFYGLVCDERKISPEFLAYQLLFFGEKYYKNISGTSTLSFFRKEVALNIEIISSNLEKQKKFSDLVVKVENIKRNQKKSETYINYLFNTIMQQAFRGELT